MLSLPIYQQHMAHQQITLNNDLFKDFITDFLDIQL